MTAPTSIPTALATFAQDAGDAIDDASLTGTDWIRAGAIFVGSIVLAVVLARVLRRVIAHAIGPGFAAVIMSRLASYVVVLVGLFYALTALDVEVGPLIGALGLGGLVLALALQRFVENFVSSIILQARRPFTIGDTVQLDDHIGIVTDIDSRVTVLEGLDGTQIRVPNSNVIAATITNLTREPIRRSTLEVGVAYDTNLEVAHQTITAALRRVPRVRPDPEPLVNVTGFGDSSIGFSVLYWHASDVPSELAARTDLAIALHQSLDEAGISIAFPQMMVWPAANPGRPYDTVPDVVDTPYPTVQRPAGSAPGRPPLLRRGRRRRGEDSET